MSLSLINRVIGEQTIENELMNFGSSIYSGVMNSLIGLDISNIPNFNLKNDAVMRFHMIRNDIQKEYLRNGVTENAYIDGNSENDSIPIPDYTYTQGYNYRQFSGRIKNIERAGRLTPSIRDISSGEVNNKYFDYYNEGTTDVSNGALEANVGSLQFTGDNIDKDSILYKTQRLFNSKKLKSIISQFHTDPSVRYDGQVGSYVYGESHGRNLLTKDAEDGHGGTFYNGFENPYCRVWTHHYKYDRLSKTMRANTKLGGDISNSINYWGDDFEWTDDEKKVFGGKEENGENYNYAWRGKHNQERRRKNSVLDEKTGLVTIAPKYRGGGDKNVSTKSCMFSIENLAWRDYDPYSFEQALSWEQRGPLGGRIMWFPPYNLKVTESNTARWNQNEFIGRGEPIYTYINSERTGTLTFTMLVDHPSSIDYASWHNDYQHKDTDYHRYFAGCFDSSNQMADVNGSPNGGDNLIEKPMNLTDEYIRQIPNLIQAQEVKEIVKETPPVVIPEPNPPQTVEFFIFFPNNYSGCYDLRNNETTGMVGNPLSEVDPILYLLMGKGAQKVGNGYIDLPLNDKNMGADSIGNGYEMTHELGKENYIQGVGKGNKHPKWYYRIDCYLENSNEYGKENTDTKNTITQVLKDTNYVDKFGGGINLSKEMYDAFDNKNLYTFAEIASVMYSKEFLNNEVVINYLQGKGVNQENVKKLKDIFSNMNLTKISCYGVSNEHGNKKRNSYLSDERGKTAISWLRKYGKFANVHVDELEDVVGTDVWHTEKTDVNGITAKYHRNAHIKLEFSSISVTSESKTEVSESEKGVSTPEEILDNTEPIIGKEFNIHNWTLIDENNINLYLNDGYEYTDSNVYPSKGNWELLNDSNINDVLIEGYIYQGIYDENIDYNINDVVKKSDNKYYYCEDKTYNEFDVLQWSEIIKWEDILNVKEGDYCVRDSKVFHWENNEWKEIVGIEIFDKTKNYLEGDIVLYNNVYYICDEDIMNAEFIWNSDLMDILLNYKEYSEDVIYNTGDVSYYTENYWIYENDILESNIIIKDKDVEGIHWVINEQNSLKVISQAFKNYLNIFSSQTLYKINDICFWNNEFYVSKYDFKESRSEYNDETGQTQLQMLSGDNFKDYYGFKYIGSEEKEDDKGNKIVWNYYTKRPGMIYFEEDKSVSENSYGKGEKVDPNNEITLTEIQLRDLLKYEILLPTNDKIKLEDSRGEFSNAREMDYKLRDVVLYDNKFYVANTNLNEKYPIYKWDIEDWEIISGINIDNYLVNENDKYVDEFYKNTGNYQKNNILKDENGTFIYITKITEVPKAFDKGNWKKISEVIDDVNNFSPNLNYSVGEYVIYDENIYQCKTDVIVKTYEYTYDLSKCFDVNVYKGDFDELYSYKQGDICFNNVGYFVCKNDIITYSEIPWDNNDWVEGKGFDEYDIYILNKIGELLCVNLDELKFLYNLNNIEYVFTKQKPDEKFTTQFINYGRNNRGGMNFDKVYSNKDNVNSEIVIQDVADKYITCILEQDSKMLGKISTVDVTRMKKLISLYNLLNNVNYIADEAGNRKPICKNSAQVEKFMNEKKMHDKKINNNESNCKDDNIWVDRGDGLLIKLCELNEETKTKNKERISELNKLRYDKEYRFYQQYMEDHPFVLSQLREKIKYFNPAFHSMTPEGFNSRLTFLNQCTRQGATLTRSDKLSGSTANNLAFGRPPYCVLRLGDFYYQLIVIDSINYNYDISNGLQWDLNTEGNGVQPMLCEVSINFKFIGGGDIEGPVRRLQNAMTFNYYANTSFYDNRADRHVYNNNPETGISTLDKEKSYSYNTKLFDDREDLKNITKF